MASHKKKYMAGKFPQLSHEPPVQAYYVTLKESAVKKKYRGYGGGGLELLHTNTISETERMWL